MSERHDRLGSSSKPFAKKTLLEKENVCPSKQWNKLLAGTKSQKIEPRRRFFSEDLEYPDGRRPSDYSTTVKNNLATNELKSYARKTPFRIHSDRAGNDLGKGARFRERIALYDAHRAEEYRRNARISENKIKKNDEFASQQRAPLIEKQQPEASLERGRGQKFKESKAIVRDSVVPAKKSMITSIETISGFKLFRPAKSLVDLSQANKPSASCNRAYDSGKKNSIKSTNVESNLPAKRSSRTQSINKSNQLADGWSRAQQRSRSCSNSRLTVPAKITVTSFGCMGIKSVTVQKQRIGSTTGKKLGGSRDSLISGSSNILSCESSKIIKPVRDHQENENKKGSLPDSNCKIIYTDMIGGEGNMNDGAEGPLVDDIPQKVQAKVENDRQDREQDNDFAAYLLYHPDYLVDLLTIEMEKEMKAPKLSLEYIDKCTSNEARKIVVAFLIRLSTHCRYPSFILYQAVKLFDVILDKLEIRDNDLQLTAVTALWIALKKDANFYKIPSAKSMISLLADLQNDGVALLAQWERMALNAVNFNITFSDPFSIFVFYVVNYNYDSTASSGIITKIYYCGGYVIDLTLLDIKFSDISSNHLALAAAELVMSVILDAETDLASPRWHHWRNVITDGIQILPIRIDDYAIDLLRAKMIHHILESAKKHTKEEVVRKRYSRSRYGNISDFFLSKIEKLPPSEYTSCI